MVVFGHNSALSQNAITLNEFFQSRCWRRKRSVSCCLWNAATAPALRSWWRCSSTSTTSSTSTAWTRSAGRPSPSQSSTKIRKWWNFYWKKEFRFHKSFVVLVRPYICFSPLLFGTGHKFLNLIILYLFFNKNTMFTKRFPFTYLQRYNTELVCSCYLIAG